MAISISVIIPNRNGAAAIGDCISAALASRYGDFEVIVVDDGSNDDSVARISAFPCRLVRLGTHRGASAARNAGAAEAGGDMLFFTDADCLLEPDTLAVAADALAAEGADAVIGGTYTPVPHDKGFFNLFQSVFINHFETLAGRTPDYVATHAMAIGAATFRRSGGFAEDFLPILEDVEFSHRLRRAGCRLVTDGRILVRHIFGFTLRRSLANAFRKTLYWTVYSIDNRDLFADSGTASVALKVNVAANFASLCLVASAILAGSWKVVFLVPPLAALDLWINRRLVAAFRHAGGPGFAVAAALYYTVVYPLAVGAGTAAGMARYLGGMRARRGGR